MVFARELREGVRRGRIRCSVRVWQNRRVKPGGKYPMDVGHIIVDSIERIRLKDVTRELAHESGFATVKDLLQMARHGPGDKVFLVRFHYVAPGGWDSDVGSARNDVGSGRKDVGSAFRRTVRQAGRHQDE